jgi:hypothetical protein
MEIPTWNFVQDYNTTTLKVNHPLLKLCWNRIPLLY